MFNTTPKNGIWLVSGSSTFLNEHLVLNEGIGILDNYASGRRLPLSAITFVQIQHVEISDATNFRTLWCYNWSLKLLLPATLKRTINHFVDTSVQIGMKLTKILTTDIRCSGLLPFNKLHENVIILESPNFFL